MSDKASPGEREDRAAELERQASRRHPGLVGEFLQFLMHEKKWWLLPIVLILLLFGLLVILGSTGVGPFIYTGLF